MLLNASDAKAIADNKGNEQLGVEPLILANQVTSIELAMLMAFPYKSVKGLSCVECAEFERNVLYKDIENQIAVGSDTPRTPVKTTEDKINTIIDNNGYIVINGGPR